MTGFLDEPYVNLKAPLLEIDLEAGETVYLGAFELHDVGLSGGLITHDLSATTDFTRRLLVTVRFDEEATLGAAATSVRTNTEINDIATTLTSTQKPAPSDDGKGNIGFHFRTDVEGCKSAKLVFGRKKKSKYIPEKTVSVKMET